MPTPSPSDADSNRVTRASSITPLARKMVVSHSAVRASGPGRIAGFGMHFSYVQWLQPNAGAHLLPEAGATQERTLEAVRCSALLGAARVWRNTPWAPWLRSRAPTGSPAA